MDSTFGQRIGDIVWNSFKSLGKKVTPGAEEWTTLAAVVRQELQAESHKSAGRAEVVALATGTKCVTGSAAKVTNAIIDCHAESLCKRAFKRHLIGGLRLPTSPDVNCFKYHLFISQLPCGVVERYEGAPKDRREGCQRKPGRGELCPKPSCCEKIAKWLVLGFQGKLLIGYTKRPIVFESIVIGNCGREGEFEEQLLREALSHHRESDHQAKKIKSDDVFGPNPCPNLYFCKTFDEEMFTRKASKRAAPSAVVSWRECQGSKLTTEVVVEGRRQGTTKKMANKRKLMISDESLREDVGSLTSLGNGPDLSLVDSYEQKWAHMKTTNRFLGWNISTKDGD